MTEGRDSKCFMSSCVDDGVLEGLCVYHAEIANEASVAEARDTTATQRHLDVVDTLKKILARLDAIEDQRRR